MIGAEPAITVRLSENTAADAAAWVEYCNGAPDTEWGRVRAQRGQPAPYPVRCWFVGNELYAFGRAGLRRDTPPGRRSGITFDAALSPDADLDLCASACPDGGPIFVTVVNRSVQAEQTVELELRHIAGAVSSAVEYLVPQALDNEAREFQHLQREPRPIDGERLEVRLPPGAIACVRLTTTEAGAAPSSKR